jgi:hypothetical protein
MILDVDELVSENDSRDDRATAALLVDQFDPDASSAVRVASTSTSRDVEPLNTMAILSAFLVDRRNRPNYLHPKLALDERPVELYNIRANGEDDRRAWFTRPISETTTRMEISADTAGQLLGLFVEKGSRRRLAETSAFATRLMEYQALIEGTVPQDMSEDRAMQLYAEDLETFGVSGYVGKRRGHTVVILFSGPPGVRQPIAPEDVMVHTDDEFFGTVAEPPPPPPPDEPEESDDDEPEIYEPVPVRVESDPED